MMMQSSIYFDILLPPLNHIWMLNMELIQRWCVRINIVLWFSLDEHQVPTKAAPSLPPSSMGQGRKNTMKGLWVEIRTGRGHSPITVTDKTGW